VLAAAAAAQSDLPPGVLLLARIKAHMKQELAQLPNCSCLETVRRDHRPPGGKLRPLDIVRLEVLYSEGKELYAPPGDRHFTADRPSSFAGSGTIGDGYFALFLSEVTSEGRVSYEYKGEEEVGGRRLARYDYRIPVRQSGQTINLIEGSGTVGSAGTFWGDPATYDIVRIEGYATEIPPFLPITESSHSVDYVRTTLGESQFLLPRTATTRLVKFSGEESFNRMEFTQCHLYAAESSINFGMKEERPQFATTMASETALRPLPELSITTRLTTPITADTAVGSLIEATVAGNVTRKGALLIPDGATVRGRIRRLEWNEEKGGYYIVGVEFTDIDAAGTRYRFYGELQTLDRMPGVDFTLATHTTDKRGGPATEILWLPGLKGAGVFFVRGRKLELPKGFRMVWKTRQPPSEK
jgi:hypothetical protein